MKHGLDDQKMGMVWVWMGSFMMIKGWLIVLYDSHMALYTALQVVQRSSPEEIRF